MGFEQMPDINKIREELDKKNAEMEKKEQERVGEEYKRSSEQEKPTEEKFEEKPEEKSEEKVEEKPVEKTKDEVKSEEKTEEKIKEGTKKEKGEKEKEPSAAKAMEGKRKEDLEKEITENFYDELKKIKDMPDKAEGFNKTAKLKMKKTEKCFQLIENWQDSAYLDNYKGIKEIFSELDRLKPSIFLYDLKKARITNNVAKSMALNYEEWKIEDKEKLKIIKNFVNGQLEKENVFYSKDKTLKGIAKILALKDIPYKNNIDVIVKEIKNPNIKAETIAEMIDIEKDSIKKKEQSLKTLKEDMASDKLPPDEIIIEQLEKFGFDKEAVSKVLPELVKFFEDSETKEKVQKLINTKEFQTLRKTIEKITKQKEEVPDSVAKAKEHIEKKESPWGTAFGGIGLLLLILVTLSILLGSKFIDDLSGQAVGGKKKKEKK